MVLRATPYPRARETITGCPFTTECFLQVFNAVITTPPFPCSIYFPSSYPLYLMDRCHPDPSNNQISTQRQGGALQLACINPHLPNSNRLLYRIIQTCRRILVPIILGSSDAEDSATFVPPHSILIVMPQILKSSHSTDMR